MLELFWFLILKRTDMYLQISSFSHEYQLPKGKNGEFRRETQIITLSKTNILKFEVENKLEKSRFGGGK